MAPGGVIVVLNAAARRITALAEAREALEVAAAERGLPCGVAVIPKGVPSLPGFLDREIRAATRARVSRVIAVGGDGTIGAVAGALVRAGGGRADLELGIVPAGTANVLARELGIPVSLEDAAAVAVGSDQSFRIDAIEVAGRIVLTQVGIGPDALMIRDTDPESQARVGRLAYVASFLRRAFRHPAQRFLLNVDGDPIPAVAWQIVAANAGALGAPPFTWGPRIDPSDGILDVCVYDVRRPIDFLALAGRLLMGRHRRGGNTRFFRARETVEIECARAALVQGDGEILGHTPITLRLLRAAVPVVVARAPEPGREAEFPRGAGAAAPAARSPVLEDVEAMMAQQSSTWVLQGMLRHPIEALEAFDAALFLRTNGLLLGRIADRVLTATSRVMHYGEGWCLVVLAMILVDPSAGFRVAVEALPVLWLTMLTVNVPLKRFFRRRRPFIAYVKARVLGPRPRDFSFPSGHAAAAFAGALLLTAHAPALGPLFYAIAVVVALSRIYLGVHYPSDVFVGAAAGTLLAAAFRALFHAIAPV